MTASSAQTSAPNSSSTSDVIQAFIVSSKKEICDNFCNAVEDISKFRIRAIDSGSKFLDLAQKGETNPSIVVLDWKLEDMKAYTLIQKLAKSVENLANIDVIIIPNEFDSVDALLLDELNIEFQLFEGTTPAKIVEILQNTHDNQIKKIPIREQLSKLKFAIAKEDTDSIQALLLNQSLKVEISTNPKSAYIKSEIFILNHEFDQAVTHLQNVLQRLPPGSVETLQTLSTLGKSLCLSRKFQEANVIFERLSKKSPRNFSHKTGIGEALLGQGDTEGAKKQFQEVLSQDPTNADAATGMGKSEIATGNIEAAKEFFNLADGQIESYSLASFFNNHAVSLVRLGKVSEALTLYESALPLLNRYKGHIFFNIGMAHARLGNQDKAQQYFEEAKKQPNTDFLSRKKILTTFTVPETKDGEERWLNTAANPHKANSP
jgi:tetratricopeptide (TPR) repeat protein/CheY-like chemotaxis protein